MSNFLVNNVPADGLAPLGARSSAYKVMIKFVSCINILYRYIRPVLKGLTLQVMNSYAP